LDLTDRAPLQAEVLGPPLARVLEEPDDRLVVRCLEGDRAAFEHLVLRHQKGLLNHLYRLTGHRDSAADLAQEVFLKVYVSLASYDSRYRFSTWLYRIASNCAIDQLRKRQPRICSLGAGEGEGMAVASGAATPSTAPGPHDALRLQELEGRLERAIGKLSPRYRELLLLRHRHQCRYDEIARITHLPIGTVKNRIFRAREFLKRELADLLGVEA
jgi:RNA polymerase sigma-70 factor, ECF subfamily